MSWWYTAGGLACGFGLFLLGMSQPSARRLPELLRLARYHELAAEHAMQAAAAARQAASTRTVASDGFWQRALVLLSLIDLTPSPAPLVDIESELVRSGAAPKPFNQPSNACWSTCAARPPKVWVWPP